MTGEDFVFPSFSTPLIAYNLYTKGHSHNDVLLHRCVALKLVEVITRFHCDMAFTIKRLGSGCKRSCRWRFKL